VSPSPSKERGRIFEREASPLFDSPYGICCFKEEGKDLL
jgi:hypothetical protein